MEYCVLRASTYVELEEKVRQHIRDGWEPQGGVSLGITETRQHWLYQAMIRRGSTSP